jgi:hypothetical protein
MFSRTRSFAVATFVSLTAFGCFKPPEQGGTGGAGGTGGGTSATGGGAAGGSTAGPIALALEPAFLTVPAGSTARFQVFAQAPDGTMSDVTQTAMLGAEPQGVVELSPGTVKALTAGTAKLTATLGMLQAIGAVEVPAAALVSIAIEPPESSLGLGETVKLGVLGRFADGSALDVTPSATLTASSAAVSVDAAGLVRALAPGEASVTAKVGAFSADAHITVRAAKVTALRLEPAMPSLAIGGTLQLKATASYDDQSQAEVTLAAQWASSNPAVTVDARGVATGVSAGTAAVTATFGGATATLDVMVRQATLVSITVSPAMLTLPPHSVQKLIAQGRYSDGATSDVTSQAQWSSTAPGIVAVSNATGHWGEVSSLAAGSADLVARLGSVQGQAHLTVTPAMLVALNIRPANPTVRPGGTVQVSVEGTYSDASTVDLTGQATWSSSDPSIATVGNASQGGQVTGQQAGSATLRAQLGMVSATVTLTVARQNPDSIEIAPANVTIQAGTQISLRTMAKYPDGAIEDVSELATWAASPAQFATVSNVAGTKGRVHGVANGTATVEVVLGPLHASTTVTVSMPMLAQLTIFPATLRVPAGIISYLTANAVFADGSGGPATGYCTWSSSDPSVARVMVYQQYYAYVEAVAAGAATITASWQGKTATLAITVTNAALTSMQVSPAQPSLAVGAMLNVSASGVFSDLTTQNLTYTATWSSSDPTVVSVGQDDIGYEVITGMKAGTVTLTANYGGVSGSTTVTVTSATLTTIQVTPFAPRLPRMFDTYLRATGIYSDNTTQELTYRVSWSSSDPAIASVSQYGELQPLTSGAATLTANYQGISGTTLVTVTAATLQSIAVTPGMGSVSVGMELPFAATGTFSDQTTMDVSPYVTWLSSNPQVADVANAWPYQGTAKGLAVGSATLTAVRGAVTGTASISVH